MGVPGTVGKSPEDPGDGVRDRVKVRLPPDIQVASVTRSLPLPLGRTPPRRPDRPQRVVPRPGLWRRESSVVFWTTGYCA